MADDDALTADKIRHLIGRCGNCTPTTDAQIEAGLAIHPGLVLALLHAKLHIKALERLLTEAGCELEDGPEGVMF